MHSGYARDFCDEGRTKKRISSKISLCAAKRIQVSSFLEELQKYDGSIKEFDPLIWQATLNQAIVHKDCTITFVFRDGTEVKRKIKNGVRQYAKRKESDSDNTESAGDEA